MEGQSIRRRVCITLQKKNISRTCVCFLKAGFRVTACCRLMNIFEVFTLSFQAGAAVDRLVGPHFLQDVWLEPVTATSYETSLGLLCVSCVMFFLQFGSSWTNVSATVEGEDGPTAWPAPFFNSSPVDFYSWGRPKSTVFATQIADLRRTQNGSEIFRTTLGIFQQVTILRWNVLGWSPSWTLLAFFF